MVNKSIIYIFIYTLLVGCNTQNPLNSECESDFTMNVGAPELEMDENGYYHIEWLEGYNQTFATLEAITNTEGYNKIYWTSQQGIEYGGEFVFEVDENIMSSNDMSLEDMYWLKKIQRQK